MSQSQDSQVMTLDGKQVQFVLNDVDDINTEELSDIIYSDGTRAILVNSTGQILPSDIQTMVLQDEDFNQYYIKDESGEILVADEQDTSVAQSFEGAEVVQFFEEDNSAEDKPQIIYVNDDGYTINDSDLPQYQITEEEDNDNILSAENIKLETEVIDLDELIRQQGEGDTTAIIDDSGDANSYQYAILKDGKLHIQSYSGDIFPLTATEIIQEPQINAQQLSDNTVDLSRITGRNLLTGQTVTLHGYMDKLQRKIKESEIQGAETVRKRKMGSPVGLQGLLNKKLTLGKTSSGKRLVGKVIHVEKKKTDTNEGAKDAEDNGLVAGPSEVENVSLENGEENGDTLDLVENDPTPPSKPDRATEAAPDISNRPPVASTRRKVLVQERMVTKECFDQVSRTLGGLMNMDSVRKELQDRNIVVKVVERRQNKDSSGYVRTASFAYGRLQEEVMVNDDGDMLENWSFVANNDARTSILGAAKGQDEGDEQQKQFSGTANVTLIITHEKNGSRSVRVILNQAANSFRCAICRLEFPGSLQMRVHMASAHVKTSSDTCEVCGTRIESPSDMSEHRMGHVGEGRLFCCPVQECGKFFLNTRRLHRHAATHTALRCTVCLQRCFSESALKKHLALHMSMQHLSCETCHKKFRSHGDLNAHKCTHNPCKYYYCAVCKRTFSRYSNLQRHAEIHKGSEELFQCNLCGCSYHYMSSLTRHVVQNHIKRSDTAMSPSILEEGIEEA